MITMFDVKVTPEEKRNSGALSMLAAAFVMACLLSSAYSERCHASDFVDPCWTNLGSGFDVPAVVNDGQLPVEVDFVAPGPSGNTLYFRDNGTIGLSMMAVDEFPASETLISFGDAQPNLNFQAGTSLLSVCNYIGDSPQNTFSDLANYAGLTLTEVYGDISASIRCTGRQLILEFTVAATATDEKISLHFTNLDRSVPDRYSDDLNLFILFGGQERKLSLHPASITVNGQPAIARPFESGINGHVTLAIDDVLGQSGITIESRLTFAPFYDAYDAEETASGNVLAVSAACNTRSDNGVLSGRDVMITALSPAKDQVVATTIIAGADADEPFAISVDAGEEGEQIYVAGSSNSDDFPVEQALNGTDGFVIRLNSDLTTVDAGIYLGGQGTDVAHDIDIAADGTVLVSGSSGGNFPDVNLTGLDFTTLFPAVEPDEKNQDYFYAELDRNLITINGSTSFNGPGLLRPLRVLDGPVRCLGVRSRNKRAAADHCTEMTHNNNVYVNSPLTHNPADPTVDGWGNWGWMAMLWKHQHTNTGLTSGDPAYIFFDATPHLNLVSPPYIIPRKFVDTDVKADNLDRFENNESGIIFTDQGGAAIDPPGKWTALFAATAPELIVGAAIYQGWVGTPVFTNHKYLSQTYPAAFKEICFEEGDDMPKDVCAWQWNTIDQVDANCAASDYGTTFTFTEISYSDWNSDPFAGMTNQFVWRASNNGVTWFDAGLYIADPPAPDDGSVAMIAEAARRFRNNVLGETSVEIVSYTDGVESGTQTEERRLRLIDFPGQQPPPSPPRTTSVEPASNPVQADGPLALLACSPNPAHDIIQVQYRSEQALDLTLALHDAMGRRVAVLASGMHAASNYQVQLQVSHLHSGAYFLRLSGGDSSVTLPVTIVR